MYEYELSACKRLAPTNFFKKAAIKKLYIVPIILKHFLGFTGSLTALQLPRIKVYFLIRSGVVYHCKISTKITKIQIFLSRIFVI